MRKSLIPHFAAIRHEIPALAVEYLEASFDGDDAAAFKLCTRLGNIERGKYARTFYDLKIPLKAYRAFLGSAWECDHSEVIKFSGGGDEVAKMFHYARFPIPRSLPQEFQLWRGTSGLSFKEAVSGYSWTTDKDAACFFAVRSSDVFKDPLVLAATVDKGSVVFYSDTRSESEVVMAGVPTVAEVDGTFADWMQGASRYGERRNQSKRLQT